MLQAHERVGVAKRQRLDQNGSDDGEDGGGRADAERECQHRDKREDGRSPQRTNGVAKVEQRILKERRTELIARALLEALHAAELDVRLPPCLIRRHAGAQVLVRLLLDVKPDFFIETAFERVRAGERSQTPPDLWYPAHDRYGIVTSSTWLTARHVRRHCANSVSSCRRP